MHIADHSLMYMLVGAGGPVLYIRGWLAAFPGLNPRRARSTTFL